MKPPTFNNQRIIWESKTPNIVLIIGCSIFVVAAIVIHQRISCLVFWVTMVFFGGGGGILLLRLLNPRNLFVTPNSVLARQILAEQIKQKQAEPGFFTYDQDGFTLSQPSGKTYCQWTDIEVLFAYKVVFIEERFASEDIRLDIFANDQATITLTTYTPGWHPFLIKLYENLPAVPKNWVEAIALPAFETNPTLLFDKKGRTIEEVLQEYYQDRPEIASK